MKKYIFTVVMLVLFLGVSNICLAKNTRYAIGWDEKADLKDATTYEIVKVDNLSRKAITKSLSAYTTRELRVLPENKKMAYKIVLPKDIITSQIKSTIYKIILDITSKDKEIDEVILNFYSDKELVKEGFSDIGNAIWARNGDLGNVTPHIATSNSRVGYKITYFVKDNLKEYLKQRLKQETIFGYSEKQRRAIFKEIVAAEDRADDEAENMYPADANKIPMNKLSTYDWEGMLQKKFNKSNQLRKRYVKRIIKKYKLTEEELDKITTEAFKEGWALD